MFDDQYQDESAEIFSAAAGVMKALAAGASVGIIGIACAAWWLA